MRVFRPRTLRAGVGKRCDRPLDARWLAAVPEFFRSFDTFIELLDRGDDVAAGDGQALRTILGVVHSFALIGQVR